MLELIQQENWHGLTVYVAVLLALVAITSTASGILTSTVLGAALAFLRLRRRGEQGRQVVAPLSSLLHHYQ